MSTIIRTNVIPLEKATIIQTPSVGDVNSGITFNDLVKEHGAPGYAVNPDWAIRRITIRSGDVIDGISILYSRAGDHTGTFVVDHGTMETGVLAAPQIIDIGKDDMIIAVTGKHGETPDRPWGTRVTEFSIVVYHSTGTEGGRVQVHGPYGKGLGGTPFKFTTLGSFIAVAGTARNSPKSIGQDPGVGLFSLAFLDASEIRRA